MNPPPDNPPPTGDDVPVAERYSRQAIFPGIGATGQRRLMQSRVTLCGCGALGTVLASSLVRAGVGHLRVVDRDFLELHNLQRQVLFDENDVREGLPKALLEAASCGRAIVASDVPGCREAVRHHENGLLVPARDAAALAAALRLLIEDAALRRRFGQRGREMAVQEFSVVRVAEETLALYRELLP